MDGRCNIGHHRHKGAWVKPPAIVVNIVKQTILALYVPFYSHRQRQIQGDCRYLGPYTCFVRTWNNHRTSLGPCSMLDWRYQFRPRPPPASSPECVFNSRSSGLQKTLWHRHSFIQQMISYPRCFWGSIYHTSNFSIKRLLLHVFDFFIRQRPFFFPLGFGMAKLPHLSEYCKT